MIEVSSATRLAVIALATLSAGTAAAAAPALLWEVTGLANPESALPDVKTGVIYVSNVNGAPDKKDGNGFIANVGVDSVSKIERRCTARQGNQAALGRKAENLILKKLELGVLKKLFRIFSFE